MGYPLIAQATPDRYFPIDPLDQANYEASRLAPPRPVSIDDSDDSAPTWTQITIERPMVLRVVAGARTVRFRNHPIAVAAGTAEITAGAFYLSADGIAYLLVPGKWYINIPTTGTPTAVPCILLDAISLAAGSYLGSSGGGAAASADSPLVWTTFAQLTINGADGAVLAANPLRRAYSLHNRSTGGQVIAVTTENPATAATRGIHILEPGDIIVMTPADKPTTAILRGFASAAGGLLTVAEGV